MEILSLNNQNLLGGVIHRDAKQEIVQLKLQPENDLPPYTINARLNLLVLAGVIRIILDNQQTVELGQNEMAIFSPHERHKIVAVEKNTHLIVIKSFMDNSL